MTEDSTPKIPWTWRYPWRGKFRHETPLRSLSSEDQSQDSNCDPVLPISGELLESDVSNLNPDVVNDHGSDSISEESSVGTMTPRTFAAKLAQPFGLVAPAVSGESNSTVLEKLFDGQFSSLRDQVSIAQLVEWNLDPISNVSEVAAYLRRLNLVESSLDDHNALQDTGSSSSTSSSKPSQVSQELIAEAELSLKTIIRLLRESKGNIPRLSILTGNKWSSFRQLKAILDKTVSKLETWTVVVKKMRHDDLGHKMNVLAARTEEEIMIPLTRSQEHSSLIRITRSVQDVRKEIIENLEHATKVREEFSRIVLHEMRFNADIYDSIRQRREKQRKAGKEPKGKNSETNSGTELINVQRITRWLDESA